MAVFVMGQEQSHVVFLGDSNTWIGGDKCDVNRGWNYWVREMLQPTTCRSYARSGATWVHTDKMVRDTEENTAVLSDNNVVTNQIYRLQEAVEAGDIKALNLFFRTSPYAKRRGWGDHMQIGGDPDGKNLAETAREVFGLQPEGPGEAEPAPAGG
jgi:hypothetical protein